MSPWIFNIQRSLGAVSACPILEKGKTQDEIETKREEERIEEQGEAIPNRKTNRGKGPLRFRQLNIKSQYTIAITFASFILQTDWYV